MNYLLDTHTLLWSLYEPDRLSPAVAAILSDGGNALYVSHISVWETIDKASKFRLPQAGFSIDRILERIDSFGALRLAIEAEDIVASVKLPRHHNDPMDRVLIAQALRIGGILLSKDSKFHLYDVAVLWD